MHYVLAETWVAVTKACIHSPHAHVITAVWRKGKRHNITQFSPADDQIWLNTYGLPHLLDFFALQSTDPVRKPVCASARRRYRVKSRSETDPQVGEGPKVAPLKRLATELRAGKSVSSQITTVAAGPAAAAAVCLLRKINRNIPHFHQSECRLNEN